MGRLASNASRTATDVWQVFVVGTTSSEDREEPKRASVDDALSEAAHRSLGSAVQTVRRLTAISFISAGQTGKMT
jgi:hypothetical protein